MADYILGANGTAVKIVSITSITLLLVHHILELDVENVTVCSDNFYQGLLGYDLLCGHNEVLGMSYHHLTQDRLTRCY